MTPEQADRLENDPDYCLLKRFGYSIARALERYPDGLPTHVIAQALGISEAEVEAEYLAIAAKLRGVIDTSKLDPKHNR